MKRSITLLSFLGLFFCQQNVFAANATITISDFAYTPQQVTINAGESVTWQWSSGTHPTASDNSPAEWTTFTLDGSNPSFTKVFNTPGTFDFHCEFHGSMTGTITVLSPSGIREDQKNNNLLIAYPNPASGLLKLALNTPTSDNYQVKFTNAIGSTVKSIAAAELQAAGKELEVDLSALPAGVYFYSLWNNDKIVDVKRLVISK
jgi:plastocyanin